MKSQLMRVSALLALGTFIVLTFFSMVAHAQQQLVIGEQYNGTMWACGTQEDATDIAVKEIADGIEEAVKLFTEKVEQEKCIYGLFYNYTVLNIAATAKNATTTTYVLEIDVGNFKVFALSKVEATRVKNVRLL